MEFSVFFIPIAQEILFHSRHPFFFFFWLRVSDAQDTYISLLLPFLQVFWTSSLILCPQLEAYAQTNLESKWLLSVSASGCLRYVHALIPQNPNPDSGWHCEYSVSSHVAEIGAPRNVVKSSETIQSSLYIWLNIFITLSLQITGMPVSIHLFQLFLDSVVIIFCVICLLAPKDNILIWCYFAGGREKICPSPKPATKAIP